MNKLLIILLMFSTNLFSQNNSILKFDEVKKGIELNTINLLKVDLLSEKINDTEFQILKVLNGNKVDFNNKIITFISGSAGTTISKKLLFLNLS